MQHVNQGLSYLCPLYSSLLSFFLFPSEAVSLFVDFLHPPHLGMGDLSAPINERTCALSALEAQSLPWDYQGSPHLSLPPVHVLALEGS